MDTFIHELAFPPYTKKFFAKHWYHTKKHFRNLWRSIKRFFVRHYMLKIDGLKAFEWYDKDYVLLYANFQILVDFIELEKPGETIDWDSDEAHKATWAEIMSLYTWWKHERPNRVDPLDDPNLVMPKFKTKSLEDHPGFLQMIKTPENEKNEEEKRFDEAVKESINLDKQWDQEDEANLIRLIKIRDHLWT